MGNLLAILNQPEASDKVTLCLPIYSCFVLLGYRVCLTQLNLKVVLEVFLYVEMVLEFPIYFFADDSVLFCRAKEAECRVILDILVFYEKGYDQKIKKEKNQSIF